VAAIFDRVEEAKATADAFELEFAEASEAIQRAAVNRYRGCGGRSGGLRG